MSRTRIPLSRQDENARLMKERLEMSTAEIGLSVRTTNCLEERGIFTVRDLLNRPQNSFRRSGSADLLRLLRLAGAFFSLAFVFLPPASPAAPASASAASASARNSLRLTTLRAMG